MAPVPDLTAFLNQVITNPPPYIIIMRILPAYAIIMAVISSFNSTNSLFMWTVYMTVCRLTIYNGSLRFRGELLGFSTYFFIILLLIYSVYKDTDGLKCVRMFKMWAAVRFSVLFILHNLCIDMSPIRVGFHCIWFLMVLVL